MNRRAVIGWALLVLILAISDANAMRWYSPEIGRWFSRGKRRSKLA